MDTFHSAKIISLTSGTGITKATLGNHKAVTLSAPGSAMGVTLDFVSSDGTLNTGHISTAASTTVDLPTRVYGLTANQAGSIIVYN